jgi:uncharacterized protein YjlB
MAAARALPPGNADFAEVGKLGKARGWLGDVVVIPAGTGHWFTRIEDHIDYVMVRIDPDKVTPLKSEAQSAEYLSKPAKRGE